MDEFIMPNSKTQTGAPDIPMGYEKFVVLSGLNVDEKTRLTMEFLQNVANKEIEIESKLKNQDAKVEEYKKQIETRSFKGIEIIGVFSAILALLIIDVSIVKSVDSFLAAILLISALTCFIIVFITLIHI